MTKNLAEKILKRIPKILSSTSDVEAGMGEIVGDINTVLNIEYSAIYYLSEENAYLKYPKISENFFDFCLDYELLQKLENDEMCEITASQVEFKAKSDKIESFFAFPLKIRETVFGFILVGSANKLSEEQTEALKALASVAAYAIKDSELSNVFKIQLKALQNSVLEKSKDVKLIKEQNERILEADKAKNEFIANVSHELRTPLNAIIGFSEVLSSKIFGELNEKQTEYINDIYTSGVHLLGMINEILDISKLESNAMKLNYSDFLPETAINEVLSVMRPLADKKHLNVSFENAVTAPVCLDYQKFQQILYNLTSNAIKFTPEKGKISITTRQKSKNIELVVQDSGVGIDKKSQEKVFEKFVQLENTYTKTGSSTGLGLTITKRFVEMMGGNIVLESEKDKGAKFIITLPMEHK